MEFSIVSWHVPQEEGTAPGRSIWATAQGLRSLGVEVKARAWGWQSPVGPVPEWCTWEPLPAESWVRMKARALLRPRSDVTRIQWTAAENAVALAYEPVSFAAVGAHPNSVLLMYYAARLDARALGHWSLKLVQDRRAERRSIRRARAVLAHSDRVAREFARSVTVVPIPYAPPSEPLAFVEEPVALMLADWRWAPNRRALDWLLRAWTPVAELVPGARLVLAGRHFHASPSELPRGVEVIGEVTRSRDALEQAAVLAFPCPPTSGPKIKVVEAMSYGLPVITTEWGAEGIAAAPGEDFVVSSPERFAEDLAGLLADRDRRATIAARAPRAIASAHGPRPAAEKLVAAVADAMDPLASD